MNCPFCGVSAVVPGARYCHNCGGPMSPVASLPATERRLVTVLFCDLSDFTAWSEGQDPERVGAVTDRLLAECARAVTEYGGHVDKLTGDGLMAVFGAPIAHDDDTERAVRAAQQMRHTVRKQLKMESGGGVPMGLRVGLRSGLVVAGVQASVEYTVIGDTVNTASRLADVAMVGTVYASAETMEATKHIAAWRRLNPIRLKGKRQPVEAYELLGLHDEPGIKASLGDRAPFVGRDAEMGRVQGRLEAAIDRNEAVSLVMTADAGIGKTRMALECARMASNRGARVLSVRAAAYGQGYRLGPLADLVRKAIGLSIGDDRETAERQLRKVTERHASGHADGCVLNVDLLLSFLGYGPRPQTEGRPSAGDSYDQGPNPIPTVVADLFNLLATETPLVLIVDDLHAATNRALNVLGAAVAALSGPVLVLMFGRPSLVRTSGVLNQISEAEAYTLTPLRGADAARLLSAFCDNGKVDPDDEARLLETAQGNPYYLAELVTLLTERGMLTQREGRWRLAPGSLNSRLLSADLTRVLTARIDALPPDARSLLREASVVGDVIPEGALEVLTNGADSSGPLEELLNRRMLRRRTHGGYRFVTPLMREAAYAGLGKVDLAEQHARLTQWAATTDSLNEVQADEFTISHAMYALGAARTMALPRSSNAFWVRDAVVRAFGRSARRAMDNAEPDNALQLLDRSSEVRHLTPEDQLVRNRALLRLGRASDALASLEQLAAELHVSLPLDGEHTRGNVVADASVAAQALMLAGRAFRSLGEPESAQRVWQRSYDLATEANLPVEQADVLCRLGMFDYLRGQLRAAEERFSTALDVASRAEDRRAQAWALQHLAWVSTSLGDFSAADDALGRAARLFAAQNDRMGRAWVRSSAAFARMLAGRLRESQRLAEAFRPFGEKVGDVWAVGMLRSVSAYSACELGEFEGTDALARKGFRDFDRVDDDWGRGFALLIRSIIARELGEIDHAIELVTESEKYGAIAKHPLLTGLARTVYGHCLLDKGDAAGAEEAAKFTLTLAVPHDVLEPVKVGPTALLAEARAAVGDHEGALHWMSIAAEQFNDPALMYSRRRAVARYAQLLLQDGQKQTAREWALRALDAPGEDVRSGELLEAVCRATQVSPATSDRAQPAMS